MLGCIYWVETRSSKVDLFSEYFLLKLCGYMWRHESWVEEGRWGGGRKCTILSPEAMGFHCLIDIKVQGTDISLMHNKDKLHSSRSSGRHELTGLQRKLCDALP